MDQKFSCYETGRLSLARIARKSFFQDGWCGVKKIEVIAGTVADESDIAALLIF